LLVISYKFGIFLNFYCFLAHRRSVDIIGEKFEDICDKDQEIFAMEKNFEILPEEIQAAITAMKNSNSRFTNIMDFIRMNEKYVSSTGTTGTLSRY
jgi:hypothetical protein